jgi:hypothetical protein
MHDHCVSLISLNFLGFVEHWDFVGNPCGMPTLKIKYKIHLFNLSLHNVDCCHFISF